jgi:hypothetical protein
MDRKGVRGVRKRSHVSEYTGKGSWCGWWLMRWRWNGKGREGGIWSCVSEYAVWVAEALALEWKGGEGGDTVVRV